jgi:DNA-binding transcriptional regulator LsrR (DeoR family)
MTKRPRDSLQRKLDLAARAAWLYFIADNTQDEIAGKLNVSRQAAQRLVALAVSEKLIKFRLDHPIAECMELGEALRERYEMEFCQVTPSDSGAGDSVSGPAIWAAERLESYLSQKAPMILAVSTGRTLRAAVDQVAVMTQPHHKIVSLVGNMARDGRASPFDVVMRLADRVGAQCFPIPTPVIASSVEERALLQSQRSFVAVKELAEQAKASFVGMSEIAWEAPLHRDGFVNDGEIAQLIEMGAVGEIAGWAFDGNGTLIADATNERVAGLPLEAPPHRPTIAVAGGRAKANAIRAALRGKLISGLITDESAARAILADD